MDGRAPLSSSALPLSHCRFNATSSFGSQPDIHLMSRSSPVNHHHHHQQQQQRRPARRRRQSSSISDKLDDVRPLDSRCPPPYRIREGDAEVVDDDVDGPSPSTAVTRQRRSPVIPSRSPHLDMMRRHAASDNSVNYKAFNNAASSCYSVAYNAGV